MFRSRFFWRKCRHDDQEYKHMHPLIKSFVLPTGIIKLHSRSYASKFATFNYKDAFNLNSLLTQDEISVRNAAEEYCQSRLKPRVTMSFRNESKIKSNLFTHICICGEKLSSLFFLFYHCFCR